MNFDASEALSQFAALVDEKVGIIRSVDVIKLSETDPYVFLAYADPCDTIPLAGIAASNRGAACAINFDEAVLRSCGECIERYCSAFFDLESLLLASERELDRLGRRYVRIADVYPYAEYQHSSPEFPYGRVNPDTRIRWVRGQTSASEIWLPASCVFVPYHFMPDDEPFTHMPISTGLAAGRTVESCIRKGICEIVERDALMIVWHSQMPVPRIDPLSCYGINAQIDRLLGSIRTSRTYWLINLLTVDVDIPVISAALIDEGSPPLTSFGIAASRDPAHALQRALEEAVLTRLLVNRSPEVFDQTLPASWPIRTLRDHLLIHARSSRLRSHMRFLTEDGPFISFDEVRLRGRAHEDEEHSCNAAGLEVSWVDITTPDVSDFGFKVVRTIIPGMQPLDIDHRYRYLGGSRLLSVPRKLGLKIDSIDQLNPEPHPFP